MVSYNIMMGDPEWALERWTTELSGMTRIPIDTAFFTGVMYVLIQGLEHAPVSFFHTRRRCFQYVVQGRFKTTIPCSTVYTGQAWDQPLAKAPPSWLQSLLLPFIRNIQPGLQMSFTGDNPYILSPLMSTMQTIHMNVPGNAPTLPDSIASLNMDDLSAMGLYMTPGERKKYFAKPENIAQHVFDPAYVYTFNFYQHVLRLDTFTAWGYDIRHILGKNPIQIMAVYIADFTTLTFQQRAQIYNYKLYKVDDNR